MITLIVKHYLIDNKKVDKHTYDACTKPKLETLRKKLAIGSNQMLILIHKK